MFISSLLDTKARLIIGARLGIAFAIVLAFLMAITATSLLQMQKVFTSANYATVNSVPSVVTIDEAFDAFIATQQLTLKEMGATDRAMVASLAQAIADKRGEIDKHLHDYEPLISDDADRGLLEAERQLLARLTPAHQKAQELIQSCIVRSGHGWLDLQRAHQSFLDRQQQVVFCGGIIA